MIGRLNTPTKSMEMKLRQYCPLPIAGYLEASSSRVNCKRKRTTFTGAFQMSLKSDVFGYCSSSESRPEVICNTMYYTSPRIQPM